MLSSFSGKTSVKLAHPAGVGAGPTYSSFYIGTEGCLCVGRPDPTTGGHGPPHVKAKHALGMRRLARSFEVCDQPCLNKSKAPSTNVVGTTPRSRPHGATSRPGRSLRRSIRTGGPNGQAEDWQGSTASYQCRAFLLRERTSAY